ncbi:MAG: hypothetical protein WBM11_04185 [Terriglobales bacterium]
MAIKQYLMVPCPKCQAKPGEPCKLIGNCIKTAPGAWVSTKTCHEERVALSKGMSAKPQEATENH